MCVDDEDDSTSLQSIDWVSADIPWASISAIVVAKRHLFTSYFICRYTICKLIDFCEKGREVNEFNHKNDYAMC